MQGRLYRLTLRGEYDGLPHPHVVVIEFAGSRDCLVVPGFDAEGFKVNEAVVAYRDAGYATQETVVELDNAAHVRFNRPFTGKPAKWLIARNSRQPIRLLNGCECMGVMDDAGLSLIARGLLILATARPERFSAALLKRLRKLAE